MSRRHGRIEQFNMRRRLVVRGVSAVTVFIAAGWAVPAWARPKADLDYLLIEAAAVSIRDREAAGAVWQAFHRSYPHQEKSDLLQVLRGSLQEIEERCAHNRLSLILTSLKRTIRSDFAEGRVLELNGWILSRTEVGLCALASGARVS